MGTYFFSLLPGCRKFWGWGKEWMEPTPLNYHTKSNCFGFLREWKIRFHSSERLRFWGVTALVNPGNSWSSGYYLEGSRFRIHMVYSNKSSPHLKSRNHLLVEITLVSELRKSVHVPVLPLTGRWILDKSLDYSKPQLFLFFSENNIL